jgi:hypothetical protein|tara:strand:- start:881 stop:3358 length:2478 start_codon:yes stop_codon:yes gene_type:complete
MIRNSLLNFFLLTGLFILLSADVSAQTSTISGTVIDSEARYPLPGAYVQISTIEGFMTPTDMDGRFSFSDVPIGRHVVKLSFMGYESRTIDGIVLMSGRPVVLEVKLSENVFAIEAAEVTAIKTGEVMNEMATVSARAFTVEETDRYAGSRGDPARMASNFAGVQGADDSRNDIVVRGNSPSGVLWRIEGVDLTNPNHFSVPGTGGGPVAIVNNKTLANSDFFTAAFPAEFGNSTAAVFDLKLRNGNQDHWHGSAQLGFLGTEVLVEGPLNRDKRSSLLINYRYSTASIFSALGIDIGTSAVPKYQDGSFKLFTPTKGGGSLSFWGIGGNSSVDILISNQVAPERNIYGDNDRDQYFRTGTGMMGLTHTQPLNSRSYIKTTLAVSRDRQDSDHDYVTRDLLITGSDTSYTNINTSPLMTYGFVKDRVALAVHANHKLETTKGTATLRMGLNTDLMMWSFQDSIRAFTDEPDSLGAWGKRWDSDMNGALIQPFIQVKRRPNEALTWTAGLHVMVDTRTGSASLFEPRLGIQWVSKGGTVWSAGSGLHSQIQSPYIYASTTSTEVTGQLNMPNQELGFTRSLHNVIGMTRQLSDLWTLKLEAYHQHLFDIPVADLSTAWGAENGSYSLINAGGGFSRLFPDTLLNEGTGRNMGVEITLSRAFREGWFVLFTASVFDAKYKGADGVSRNTDFNGKYSWNFLASKEWKLSPSLGLVTGLKATQAGGRWYGPVDDDASLAQREIIFIDQDRNTQQFDDYFRLDIKTNLTWNRPETTHELGIDFVNILGTENILKLTYAPDEMDPSDPNYSPVREEYQLGFLPIFFYRMDF